MAERMVAAVPVERWAFLQFAAICVVLAISLPALNCPGWAMARGTRLRGARRLLVGQRR